VPQSPQAESSPALLVVGRVVAAQGLGGELRVLPLSDFPQRFTLAGPRWLQDPQGRQRQVALLSGRQLPGRELFVVRLEGVGDRSGAEALLGCELMVKADDRPPLDPGEFHVLDLVGLEVRLMEQGQPGAVVGTVTDLIHAGNDLLEIVPIDAPQGPRRLIPFVEAIVPEVHLDQGWLGLTPPPGLLEL